MVESVDIAALRKLYAELENSKTLEQLNRIVSEVWYAVPALLDELEAFRRIGQQGDIMFSGSGGIWFSHLPELQRRSEDFVRSLSTPPPDDDSGDSIDFSHVPKGEAD